MSFSDPLLDKNIFKKGIEEGGGGERKREPPQGQSTYYHIGSRRRKVSVLHSFPSMLHCCYSLTIKWSLRSPQLPHWITSGHFDSMKASRIAEVVDWFQLIFEHLFPPRTPLLVWLRSTGLTAKRSLKCFECDFFLHLKAHFNQSHSNQAWRIRVKPRSDESFKNRQTAVWRQRHASWFRR